MCDAHAVHPTNSRAFFALGDLPDDLPAPLPVGEADDGPWAQFVFRLDAHGGNVHRAGLKTRGVLDRLVHSGEAAGSIVVHDNSTATAYLVAGEASAAAAAQRLDA